MKRPAALAWSIALHAVLLYGLGRMSWGLVEPAPAPVQPSVVVWLRNPPPPVKPANRNARTAAKRRAPTQRAPPRRLSAGRVKRRPGKVNAAPPAPQARSAGGPSRRASGASEQTLVAAHGVKAAPAGRRSAALSSRAANAGKTPSPDLEQLRHRAVAAVLAQRRRERGYKTFSLRDLPARSTAADIPGPKPPKTNVFRYGSQGLHDSAHVLAYNRPARSKIGRWLADTCHALTDGGIGVSIDAFGLMDLCAENQAHGDLFESIKPDYLKRVTVPAARPARLADAGDGTGD